MNGLKVRYCYLDRWNSKIEKNIEEGNWGEWKGFANCPKDMFITGAEAQYEGNGFGDYVGMTGLKFRCRHKSDDSINVADIMGHEGDWGVWQGWKTDDKRFAREFQVKYSDNAGMVGLTINMAIPRAATPLSTKRVTSFWRSFFTSNGSLEFARTVSITLSNSKTVSRSHSLTIEASIASDFTFGELSVGGSIGNQISNEIETTIDSGESQEAKIQCKDIKLSETGYWVLWQYVVTQESDGHPGFTFNSNHLACTPSKNIVPRCPPGYCFGIYCQKCLPPFENLGVPDPGYSRHLNIFNGKRGNWLDFMPKNDGSEAIKDDFFACGVSARFMEDQGVTVDDVALNGLRVRYCSLHNWGDQMESTIHEGDWGEFNGYQLCPQDMYIDGASAQYDPPQENSNDHVGMSGLRISCRHKENPYDRADVTVLESFWGEFQDWRKENELFARQFQVKYEKNNEDSVGMTGLTFDMVAPGPIKKTEPGCSRRRRMVWEHGRRSLQEQCVCSDGTTDCECCSGCSVDELLPGVTICVCNNPDPEYNCDECCLEKGHDPNSDNEESPVFDAEYPALPGDEEEDDNDDNGEYPALPDDDDGEYPILPPPIPGKSSCENEDRLSFLLKIACIIQRLFVWLRRLGRGG